MPPSPTALLPLLLLSVLHPIQRAHAVPPALPASPSSPHVLPAPDQRASLADADNICSQNPSIGRSVMAAMNLSFPGLEQVAEAARQLQFGQACELLVAYYMTCASGSWLRVPPVTPGTGRAGGEADEALDDIFHLTGVQEVVKVPRNSSGGLDWYFKGPRNDPECMNCVNRHEYFDTLLGAWRQTGNPIYAAKTGDLIYDWVMNLPCNPCTTGTMESPWRILEVGIRTVGPWPRAFYGLQGCPAFNTSSRVLLLLGLHEHGIALMKYGTEGVPNWRMQQWAGLGVIAMAFPELFDSATWLQQALAGIQKEIEEEVYPDGVETEQAAGYDAMAANNFYQILVTLKQAGQQAPPAYSTAVERMYTYLAYAVDQSGFMPRNGDADLTRPWESSVWRAIKDHFNRSDWEYVYTGGKAGTRPPGSPTVLFPWAGQLIMKSGYTSDDLWAFFDIGPYGTSGHAHRDKLHLDVRGYGSLLLVDSGRFPYQGTDSVFHSVYAPSTRAHNTLTIDGCNQQAAPPTAAAPVDPSTYSIGTDYDYARGAMSLYEQLAGTATHTRAVLFRKGQWFVVVDAITTDRPRAIQATWHAHPNSSVHYDASSGVAVVGGVPRGQIAVIPAANSTWTVSLAKGQQPPAFPYYQGWFSTSYLDIEPSPVLVYDTHIARDAVFAWLLLPSPTPGAVQAGLQVVARDASSVTVRVSVSGQPDVVERIALS